jgi:hypothetical protein
MRNVHQINAEAVGWQMVRAARRDRGDSRTNMIAGHLWGRVMLCKQGSIQALRAEHKQGRAGKSSGQEQAGEAAKTHQRSTQINLLSR